LALARGGALETVLDKVTGVFFKEQTLESLLGAMEEFKKLKFDGKAIRAHALRFNNKEGFKENIKGFIGKISDAAPA
jgi:hypothetical protein